MWQFKKKTSELTYLFLRPKKNPLFYVDLTIDKDGPRYSTLYENFEAVLGNLFEKAIQSTQAIPQLEKVNFNFN